jgi:hypothetical protein
LKLSLIIIQARKSRERERKAKERRKIDERKRNRGEIIRIISKKDQ